MIMTDSSFISRQQIIDDLIYARRAIERGDHRHAVLHMKWAMERLLPEDQRHCTDRLPDKDPDKTLQGYLDNISGAL